MELQHKGFYAPSGKARNRVTHKSNYNINNGVQLGGLVVLTTNEKVNILKVDLLLVEYASLNSPNNGKTGLVLSDFSGVITSLNHGRIEKDLKRVSKSYFIQLTKAKKQTGQTKRAALGVILFFPFINAVPASLPSSVSCSLYTDDPALRPSYPSMPVAVEATQEALMRLYC